MVVAASVRLLPNNSLTNLIEGNRLPAFLRCQIKTRISSFLILS
jgi:hypothetical protein